MTQGSPLSRSLLFVTGTRADFGKLEPLAARAAQDGHRVTFFVTGMHMMEKYGLTKIEVHRSGQFQVVEYMNQREGDPQDIVLAKTVIGFSDVLQEAPPDLVLVHGDRIEALACCLVCATNYIPCAHIEGGEVSGTIDEIFRHCNTKLASAHLVSSKDARARVLRLGERADRVHVIGSPELDTHAQPTGVTLDQVRARYAISAQDYGICVFHPVTSERETIGAQAQALFGALEASDRYFVVIRPNNDPGAQEINRVIDALPPQRFRVLPSMRFLYFSELMRNAAVILGNSSMGVREAPFMGVPSFDVGTRQANRAQAASLISGSALDGAGIAAFLDSYWGKRFARHTGFGAGNAAERFADLLRDPGFWDMPLQKHFEDAGTDG
ncbi:MAG: UDP-N-acetylglucosamine 2-epimerase [Pseudomonadota bacterium]